MSVLVRRASASARLRAAIGSPRVGTRVGAIVGVEHEFTVRLDGRAVDFRHVIHRLGLPGRRIDAADPDAYRGPWGGTITTDGREAEIATPPISVGPGAGPRLAAVAAEAAARLRAALPAEATLSGYSTHLSVEVPRSTADLAARHLAERWAPALAWLLDGPESPGILVRPRVGRVEIGGDFIEGERLALAGVFAVGAVRAAVAATSPGARSLRAMGIARLVRHGAAILPKLGGPPADAVDRYGWFVGDSELGAALHAEGADAWIPLTRGGTMTVRDHLGSAWRIARTYLTDIDGPTLERLDDLVAAAPVWPSGALGQASAEPAEAGNEAQVPAVRVGSRPEQDPSVRGWAAAARSHQRPGFVATPAIMSWDFVVFRLQDTRRFLPDAWICLPREVLGGAIVALDAGRLDDLLLGFLAANHGETSGDRTLLASPDQTSAAGLYRAVSSAAHLVTPEQGPAGGGGKRRRDSRDNRPDQSSGGQPSPGGAGMAASAAAATAATGFALFGLPAAALAGIGAVALAAVVGGAVLLGGSKPAGTGTPSGGPRAALDACTLLTTTDVAEVLGTPAGPGTSTIAQPSSQCRFDLPNGTGPSFSLAPDVVQRTSAVILTVLAAPVTAAEVGSTLPQSTDMTYLKVPDVGDGAWWAQYGPNHRVWGNALRVAYAGREFLVILYGAPTDPSTWQAAATELARRVIAAVPNGWPATAGGYPVATSPPPLNVPSATLAGDLADLHCDPWLTAADVAGATGLTPASIEGSNYLNDGQPADCTWTFTDGSTLAFLALEQVQYGGPDVDESGNLAPGLGDPVPAMGTGAYYDTGGAAGFPPELHWFPDSELQLYVASTTIDLAGLTAVAQRVRVPLDWRAARPTSRPVLGGALDSGTATISVSAGTASGFVAVPFGSGGFTTSGVRPVLTATWGDESGRTLFMAIGSPDAGGVSAGTYSTGPNVQVGFRAALENGEQLDATLLPLQCTVNLQRTFTGGITGTWQCTGTDPTYGAFSADGQFNAEPIAVPGA